MKETLCWTCSVPGTRGCSWDRAFIPVEGWTATPTRIWQSWMQEWTGSFVVHSCPLYQEEYYRPAFDKDVRKGCGPAINDEDLLSYIQEGLSDMEIAAMCGVVPNTIYKRQKRLEQMNSNGQPLEVCARCGKIRAIVCLVDDMPWCGDCMEKALSEEEAP